MEQKNLLFGVAAALHVRRDGSLGWHKSLFWDKRESELGHESLLGDSTRMMAVSEFKGRSAI